MPARVRLLVTLPRIWYLVLPNIQVSSPSGPLCSGWFWTESVLLGTRFSSPSGPSCSGRLWMYSVRLDTRLWMVLPPPDCGWFYPHQITRYPIQSFQKVQINVTNWLGQILFVIILFVIRLFVIRFIDIRWMLQIRLFERLLQILLWLDD